MKKINKSVLVAALGGILSVPAFGGFIDLTGVTTDFTGALVPSDDANMYVADLGSYMVPAGFEVDFASTGSYIVQSNAAENAKAFPTIGGNYQILLVLADPITSFNSGGANYAESLDLSGYGTGVFQAISYWDGRGGVGTDSLEAVINLVGGGFTFDPRGAGRGFENHTLDINDPTRDSFDVAADGSSIDFDLFTHQLPGDRTDRYVDMAFVFVSSPIPEPSSAILALTGGVLGLLLYRNAGRRRQS